MRKDLSNSALCAIKTRSSNSVRKYSDTFSNTEDSARSASLRPVKRATARGSDLLGFKRHPAVKALCEPGSIATTPNSNISEVESSARPVVSRSTIASGPCERVSFPRTLSSNPSSANERVSRTSRFMPSASGST